MAGHRLICPRYPVADHSPGSPFYLPTKALQSPQSLTCHIRGSHSFICAPSAYLGRFDGSISPGCWAAYRFQPPQVMSTGQNWGKSGRGGQTIAPPPAVHDGEHSLPPVDCCVMGGERWGPPVWDRGPPKTSSRGTTAFTVSEQKVDE